MDRVLYYNHFLRIDNLGNIYEKWMHFGCKLWKIGPIFGAKSRKKYSFQEVLGEERGNKLMLLDWRKGFGRREMM